LFETKMQKRPPYTLQPTPYNLAFTLIELLVVISIMGIMATLMLANFAAQRVQRDINIAQNELVSHIREIQSYTLSSRTIPGGQVVQYYVMKFDLAKPGQYTIQAMYNVSSSPRLADVQVVQFPSGITLASSSPVQIVRNGFSTQTPTYPSGCALLSFATPFAKTIMNNGCSIAAKPVINAGDDYQNVINRNTISPDSAGFSASADSIMTIILEDKNKTRVRTITLNGITGTVTFK
jgi:prepilin-type N-terminal cleavage/methylation domain-containing protein